MDVQSDATQDEAKRSDWVDDWELAFAAVVSFGCALVFLAWRARWFV